MYQKGEKLVFTDADAIDAILEFEESTEKPFLQIWYKLPHGGEGSLFSWDDFRKARPDEVEAGHRILK
ncbi:MULTISPECIES: hypothetical protein [Acinetobacter]|uniref:Uncharacterized protein n=1 Tax=Acinetobacter indicus TaxID=756892 RepID=A0A6C0Y742_9GAMM|nr:MULTISPECIES: hypothetical protein [Acinetobacter]QIC71913.1 hypothetical protein FSC09_16105 [Acinetobacter indicus]QKQ71450.1 hypothetical protein E5Y90_14560 [Acinetobacter sp. 10FS3-1]